MGERKIGSANAGRFWRRLLFVMISHLLKS